MNNKCTVLKIIIIKAFINLFHSQQQKNYSDKGRTSQDIRIKLLSLGTNASLAKKVKLLTFSESIKSILILPTGLSPWSPACFPHRN